MVVHTSAPTEDNVGACIVHKQQRLAVALALPALQHLVQVIHRPWPVHQAGSGCLKRRLQVSSPPICEQPIIDAPLGSSCSKSMACLSWQLFTDIDQANSLRALCPL